MSDGQAIKPIYPGATIGILGSGQLGRMLALSARQMGYRVHVFSPDNQSPTGQVADEETVAAYADLEAVARFAKSVDVVTYEFENVPFETSETAAKFAPVRPDGSVLHTAQNRLREKTFLRQHGVPTAPFASVESEADLARAEETVGLPAVLKTAGFGYDGKGQQIVRTRDEARSAWEAGNRQSCIWEGLIDFFCELSLVAARGANGAFAAYPVMQNQHEHHILDVTTVPAPDASKRIAQQAHEITRRVMEALNVVGVLCVEFFLTKNGELLVNEMAPRPHNSGHWTIQGAASSQFEQQLRAVCGLPLGETTLRAGGIALVNLLGDVWEHGTPAWENVLAFPDVHLHLYGKAEARPGRKMGHLTALASTPQAAAETVRAARAALVATAKP